MNLPDALQRTGCAAFKNGDCITSVEQLKTSKYLLMTRRGVSIIQCMQLSMYALLKRYPDEKWHEARVSVVFIQVLLPPL
jgi:hypothetical protein